MRIPNPATRPCIDCGAPTVLAELATGTHRVHCGTYRYRCGRGIGSRSQRLRHSAA